MLLYYVHYPLLTIDWKEPKFDKVREADGFLGHYPRMSNVWKHSEGETILNSFALEYHQMDSYVPLLKEAETLGVVAPITLH
jgi:hypothetical protein